MGKLRCNSLGCSAQSHTLVAAKPGCDPSWPGCAPPTWSLLFCFQLTNLAALAFGLFPLYLCSPILSCFRLQCQGLVLRHWCTGSATFPEDILSFTRTIPGLGKDMRKHIRRGGTFSVAFKLYQAGIWNSSYQTGLAITHGEGPSRYRHEQLCGTAAGTLWRGGFC